MKNKMNCQYCGYYFSTGSSHWCSRYNGFVYFTSLPVTQCCGGSHEVKNPIKEKLDKIIELLENKKSVKSIKK